jgi:AcrR family transcriptional regulator
MSYGDLIMKARSQLLSGAGRPKRRSTTKKPVPRMAPEERRALILQRAIEFFAEYGLTAQTRALADACGVAQRLLYRYFPSKAALLSEVYEEAIASPFKAVWLVQLKDRNRPWEERLTAFYCQYYSKLLTRRWLRLFLYASLAEARMAPDYNEAILLDTLEFIARETAADQNVELPAGLPLAHELAYVLHGTISHFAIRQHIYGASQNVPVDNIIALQVRSFLAGFATAAATARALEVGHGGQP